MVRSTAAILALGLWGIGCQPSLDQTVSLVDKPRLLAVRAEPAEAPPMPPTEVTFKALFAGPRGVESGGQIEWSFCNARKPLAELGPVSPVCLQPAVGSSFIPIGSGAQVMGVIPDVACRQFGPAVPMATMPGQPPGRPVDPDPTGGYYQPVQVFASTPDGDALGVFRSRISCGLAGGTGEQQAAYGHGYRINVNPDVAALNVVGGAALTPHAGGATNAVHPGEKLTLRVSWATCPLTDKCGDGVCGPDETATGCAADCANVNTNPMGCTGAERYMNLDLVSDKIVDQRERITVSWFATGGAFDSDTTGRDSTDTATTSDDGWQAPSQSTPQNPVVLWVVLHDDRGGVGWQEYALDVR